MVDEPLGGVDEDERDVGTLGRLACAQLRVVLDALPVPALAADARGVDEDEGAIAAFEDGVDRVAGRAGRLRHDHAVVAEDRVQERRLADVRPPEDRDANRIVRSLLAAGSRQLLDDDVQEVTAAVSLHWAQTSGLLSKADLKNRVQKSRRKNSSFCIQIVQSLFLICSRQNCKTSLG